MKTTPHFSDDEVREIFDRAAGREEAVGPAGLPAGQGASMVQLREIAAEIGVSPDQVEVVARAVARERGLAARGGGRIEKRRTFGVEVSDEEWRRMVEGFRGTFQTRGLVSEYGGVREWASGAGDEPGTVTIRLESAGDGSVLMAERSSRGAERLPRVVSGGLGIATVSLATAAALVGLPALLVGAVVLGGGAVTAGSWLAGPRTVRARAGRDEAQLERALTRAAGIQEGRKAP